LVRPVLLQPRLAAMVIPLPANSDSIQSLPEDARRLLGFTKYFVMGLWVFSFIFGIFTPLSALSTWCLAIFGTYLLSEDPQMSQCYEIIRNSSLGACCGTGGLRMLMPFFLLGFVNSLVDSASLIQIFSTYGWQTFKVIPVDALLGIWICEMACTLISWRVLKTILPLGPLEGYQELSGGPSQGPMPPRAASEGTGSRPLGGAGPGGLSSGRRPNTDFKPFQGTGHKLGA